jgi:transcription-repair coupling factor (superfamily II helicase)
VRIDLPLKAFIPRSYIAEENLRLEAYRKIAAAHDAELLQQVRTEIEDRYGAPVPPQVAALFELAALRGLLIANGITEAATVARNLRIRPIELEDSRQVRLQRLLPDAQWRPETRTLIVPERVIPEEAVVPWVIDLLQQLTSAA